MTAPYMTGPQNLASNDLHNLFFAYSEFLLFSKLLGVEAIIDEFVGNRHEIEKIICSDYVNKKYK